MSENERSNPNWSVKADQDTKQIVKELEQLTGLSQKELFESMVSHYRAELLRGTDIERTEDIQQVSYHLAKIKDAFVGVVQKSADLKAQYAESLEQESRSHKQIVDQINQAKNEAIAERDGARQQMADAEKLFQETAARNLELEDAGRANRITIQLLEKKSSELETRIGTVEALEAEVVQLGKDNESGRRQLESLTSDLNQAKHDLAITKERLQESEQDKKDRLAKAEQDQEKAVAQIRQAADREIEQLRQVHRLEMDKAAIEAERRVLEAGQKVRDEYAPKLEGLAAKNQELLERIHALELQGKGQK